MGRANGALRQEYRTLEILDEISKLRYEGLLPGHIEGNKRNTLIKKFQEWKGKNYVPENVHPAIQWSSDSPFEIQEEDDDEVSTLKSFKKSDANPQPSKKLKLTKKSESVTQENKLTTNKRKSSEINVDINNDQPYKKIKFASSLRPLGFRWDSKNYSCSYDALFTILYNIWSQTP
ncbi:hypothetical protein BD410DRAFT_732933, partial [Rickenella mellea]